MTLAVVDLHSINPVIRLLSQQKKAPKDDVLITVNKKNSQRKAVITWTDEKSDRKADSCKTSLLLGSRFQTR